MTKQEKLELDYVETLEMIYAPHLAPIFGQDMVRLGVLRRKQDEEYMRGLVRTFQQESEG